MSDLLVKAINFRHACRTFDINKKISENDLNYILEAGRMTPSSIGLEQWKFLVIKSNNIKNELLSVVKKNISQIETCSELIVLLYRKDLRGDSEYIKKQWEKIFNTIEVPEYYKILLNSRSDSELESWSKSQCYIALGNMMTAAAYIGIDSCPMEGFLKDEVEKILKIDTSKFGVALFLPLGYRVKEPIPHKRSNFNDIVEFI